MHITQINRVFYLTY